MYIIRDPEGNLVIICSRKEDTEAFLTGKDGVGYTCEQKPAPTKSPLEIHDYKMSWRHNAWLVTASSDNRGNGKLWCRAELEQYEWSIQTFTDSYEDTYSFETEAMAQRFFKKWGISED